MIDIEKKIGQLYEEYREKRKKLIKITKEKVIMSCPYNIGDVVQCDDFRSDCIINIKAIQRNDGEEIYIWNIIVANDKCGIIEYTEEDRDSIKLIEKRAE